MFNDLGGFRSESCLKKAFAEVGRLVGLKKKFTPRGMRRTFNDLARAAQVEKHYKGKLTYAVLTHVDDDHIGGFRDVLAAGIHPNEVFVNDPREAFERFKKTGAVLLSEQMAQINASISTSNDIIDEIDRLAFEEIVELSL